LNDILIGLFRAFEIQNILFAALGMILGITFGAIPGVGPTTGVALLIPISYIMEPVQALIFLAAIYQGGTYGGQISAILFRIPGSSEAVMTILDGYEISKKGNPEKALSLGLISSTFGGFIGVIILILLTPQLSRIALSFSSAEYFALCVLGISAISGVGGSPIRGLITGLFGLLIATIGIDSISGTVRFTFGISSLQNGIHLVPVLIGLFAGSEVFYNIVWGKWKVEHTQTKITKKVSITFRTIRDFLKYKWTFLRSSLIGVFIGILPGVGATTAAIISYNTEVRFSKEPEEFGKGKFEGVIAPETANNAAVGAAFVPLLSLGIPGSGTTAVILAAFLLHGLRPGPLLIIQQKQLVYTLFGGMFISVVLMFVFALFLIKVFAKTLALPYSLLANIIFLICLVGSLVVVGRLYGVVIMFVFSIIGLVMRYHKYPAAPLVFGVVLGPILEPSLRRALLVAKGNFFMVISRPLTALIIVIAIIIFILPLIKKNERSQKKEK
jgi:putative tricarboxylic transport membrane protein